MKYNLIIIGIIAITILELTALIKGIDGQIFSFCIGTICVLIGYAFGKKRKNKNE